MLGRKQNKKKTCDYKLVVYNKCTTQVFAFVRQITQFQEKTNNLKKVMDDFWNFYN